MARLGRNRGMAQHHRMPPPPTQCVKRRSHNGGKTPAQIGADFPAARQGGQRALLRRNIQTRHLDPGRTEHTMPDGGYRRIPAGPLRVPGHDIMAWPLSARRQVGRRQIKEVGIARSVTLSRRAEPRPFEHDPECSNRAVTPHSENISAPVERAPPFGHPEPMLFDNPSPVARHGIGNAFSGVRGSHQQHAIEIHATELDQQILPQRQIGRTGGSPQDGHAELAHTVANRRFGQIMLDLADHPQARRGLQRTVTTHRGPQALAAPRRGAGNQGKKIEHN